MQILRLLFLLCLTCVAPVAQVQATNPPYAPCGLPSSGIIVESVIYTLIADCSQTGTLQIKSAVTSTVELTINGAGFTISNGTGARNKMNFLVVGDKGALTVTNEDTAPSPNVQVNINNVTFDGKNLEFMRPFFRQPDGKLRTSGIGSWILTDGPLTMENVTFTRGDGTWVRARGTATLTNVLFEDSKTWSQGFSPTVKGSLYVDSTGSVTLNNAVFRDIERTVISIAKGGRLSTTGCLSFIRVLTHYVHHSGLSRHSGTWTDGSSGRCGDITIGNGHRAVDDYSPGLLGCGLPADAVIGEDTVFTLNSDCVCLKKLTVAAGVKVTINGNGHRIQGCAGTQFYVSRVLARGAHFVVGGEMAHLRINNAMIYGVQVENRGGAVTMGNSMLAQTSNRPLTNYGWIHVYESTFEGNQGKGSGDIVYAGYSSFDAGRALFRDNMFRGNTRGDTELYTSGSGTSITLCGENEREVPAPEDGAELPPPLPFWLAVDGGALFECPEPESHNSAVTCYKQQRLGAIGLICHLDQQPAAIEILEISPSSEGSRILRVNQSQIESIGHGLVACSADGRAAVRVGVTEPVHQMIEHTGAWRDARRQTNRVIQVSMGPTFEDKVHHVVIDHVLNGHVLGTVDTRPDSAPCPVSTPSGAAAASAPAPVYAPPVVAQEPRADGSIIHVVRTGDTIWAIGVAYDVHPYLIIERNALGERGRYIYPGQELLVREASG